MHDSELERYSRQILLPGIDVQGQERLLASKVLIVGAGGLGSPVALYLAGSGIGHLTICDGDQVELSNLHRQLLHRTRDLGRNKAASAAAAMQALNPEIQVTAIEKRLAGAALHQAVAGADVVIDGSDNFPTRYAVNAAARAAGKPLVSGAVARFQGQTAVFPTDGPCFACLYPETARDETADCSDQGILAPVAGIIGSIMATETLKLLLGLGETLAGRFLLLDAVTMTLRTTRLNRDPTCTICNPAHAKHNAM